MNQDKIEFFREKSRFYSRAEGSGDNFQSVHLVMSFLKDGDPLLRERLKRIIGQDYLIRYRKIILNSGNISLEPANWFEEWKLLVSSEEISEIQSFEILCERNNLHGSSLFYQLAGFSEHSSEEEKKRFFVLLKSDFEPLKLDKEMSFVIDISERAFFGKIDSLIGREKEIEQMMTILLRKNKNNPVIIGEAGVGKTALAEGFALRIFEKDVPSPFLNKRILALNLGEMLAGSQFRGEFEKRLKSLIDLLKSRNDLILFMDEIHTIVGAGSTDGNSMDLGNLIKPALARGEFQCIGATTSEEFRKIEKDKALERRFQPIYLKEPDSAETLEILQKLKSRYESFHSVKYCDQAIKSAVNLSEQYLHDRNQPDKAIDLIDEAGGKKRLYSQIDEIPEIQESDIVELLKQRTGIQILSSEDRQIIISHLNEKINEKLKGQESASREVACLIQSVRDPKKPRGVFLFMGPTGVGKTYFVKVFAELLLGISDDDIIRFNMEEFREPHSVARLFGAPPGYVGYDEGGRLTDLVRRKGSCVILLDEVEKAHPAVMQSFLGIFDEGICRDSTNREVSFRNSYIFMTSNIQVTNQIRKEAKGVGFDLPIESKTVSEEELIKSALLKKGISREFINRIDRLIGFSPLSKESLREICGLMIEEYGEMVRRNHRLFEYKPSAVETLMSQKMDLKYGARELKRKVEQSLGKPLGDAIRNSMPGDTIIVEGRESLIETRILRGE